MMENSVASKLLKEFETNSVCKVKNYYRRELLNHFWPGRDGE
jgi:hypothetical protein